MTNEQIVDNQRFLDKWREEGWRYSVVTPVSVRPETIDAEERFDARSAVVTPGFRTWLFRTQADAQQFRRMYGVSV